MKIGFFLLVLSLTSVHATTFSQQKVSLDVKNESLLHVLDLLQEQSGYTFLFSSEDVKDVGNLSVKAENEDLFAVLERCLQGTNLNFEVSGQLVVLRLQAKSDEPEKKSVRVKGFVYDTGKQPMPGVTVKVVGIPLGTATNEKGWFAIELPMLKGALEFSFIGFKKKQVSFTEKTDTLRIMMEEDVSDLEEVVVRAYGSQKKREVVGAISSVKADEMKELPTASLVNMLQGRLAGVNIINQSGAPGSASVVAIRGFNSLLTKGASDGSPLYVIDGIPMHSFVSPVTGSNTLADIDPSMIESVEVLKDAAAASIYGSRAGNGVILITTKKGRAGEAKFSANVSYTASKLMEYPVVTGGRMERWMTILNLRNTTGIGSFQKEKFYPTSYEEVFHKETGVYDGFWGTGRKDMGGSAIWLDSLNPFYNNQTNWWKYVYRTGKIVNANLQASGGTDRLQYMISGGYYTETGIAVNSAFSRVSLNSNLTAQATKKIRLDARFYAAYTDRSRNSSQALINNKYQYITANPGSTSTLLPNNPQLTEEWLGKMNSINEKNDNYRLTASLFGEYKIFKGLTFSARGSVDFTQGNVNTFKPSTLDDTNHENVSQGRVGRNIALMNEELLRYSMSFQEAHNVEILLGFNVNKEQVHSISGEGKGGVSDYVYYYNSSLNEPMVNDGTAEYPKWRSLLKYDSFFKEKAMVSYFARFGYNYKQRYLVEATWRRDGSSTFGEGNQWADFPSVAVGWAFSQENFMKWAYWLDWGKLRASYGTSGQIFTDEYLAHGLMQITSDFFLGEGGVMAGTAISPDLTWEKTEQYNVGLDLDMFNYRLKMKLDYYYKYTSALIYAVPLANDILITNKRTENAMALSNEGIELELEADIIRKDNISWRMKFNAARNWNRFEESYNGKDVSEAMVIGRPTSGIYLYKDEGYYDTEDEVLRYYDVFGKPIYLGGVPVYQGGSGKVGTQKVADLDGDNLITNKDMYYVGIAQPLAHGGWINEVLWKNFSVNILFNYCLGRSMLNLLPSTILSSVKRIDVGKYTFWEKPGDETDFPRLGSRIEMKLDSNLEKVHSVSLKQITLGYDLPKKIAKKAGLEGIRFFLTGENLFYLSNYSGLNPEVVDVYSGLDAGTAYPLPRKWTVGLTLNF